MRKILCDRCKNEIFNESNVHRIVFKGDYAVDEDMLHSHPEYCATCYEAIRRFALTTDNPA